METECLYILLCKSSGIFRRSHFELLKLKFAQFGEEYSNHEWTPIDTNRSVQFVFIRGFFLIVCGCGYAALWPSVNCLHSARNVGEVKERDESAQKITAQHRLTPIHSPLRASAYLCARHPRAIRPFACKFGTKYLFIPSTDERNSCCLLLRR
jgi:hypothetical protein